MGLNGLPASEVIPGPPEPGEAQDFRVKVTRQPYDDYFHLEFTRNGRVVTEELETEDTKRFFLDRFAKSLSREQELKREEALGKMLDECWNFYETVITIPADVYREPALPFPQFQPKV